MDAYTPDAWGAPFTAIAGSAAALTGLLFVAISINLERILKVEGLVSRAFEVLLLLVAVLSLATILLMPGQPLGSVAAEVLTVGVGMVIALASIQVRAPRRAMGLTLVNFSMRVVFDQLGPVLLIAAGISLFLQNGGGLYLVVPAMIAAMIAAMVGAWVLLVEILR